MKKYPKTYENVYTARRVLDKCKISKVSPDLDVSELEYRRMLRKIIKDNQRQTFDYLVKFVWLVRRFCYNGIPRTKFMKNGQVVDAHYGIYMRHFVGFDHRLITRNRINSKIMGYIDEFFPDIYFKNPFEKKLKFPYRYMNFECLYLVYQMPERLELLKYGDKHQMRYTEFIDYVINYALSKTDELGDKNYFSITFGFRVRSPFIKYKYYKNKYE